MTAAEVIALARQAGVMLVTAESCTGGMIIGALTDIAGASAVVDRGFITYSNEAKHEMLGVPMAVIEEYGAVSQQVAELMAVGALEALRASGGGALGALGGESGAHPCLAVAVTGIAGPDGGSADKPVGLVWFGLAMRGGAVSSWREVFDGGRENVRAKTTQMALAKMAEALRDYSATRG